MKRISIQTFLPLLTLCLFHQCPAFMVGKHCQRTTTISISLQAQISNTNDRRTFMNQLQLLVPAAFTGISTLILSPDPVEAALMDSNVEQVGKLTTKEAKDRFKLAILDVDELLANYGEISNGGGDNVRRYLGTVGIKSHMYGITKVLKELREEADDIIEFTEASNEFEAYLFQAEGAAYSSLFAEHSSAKSTSASLLVTAKKDVVNMRRFMGDLATQLHLDV